MNPNEAMTIDGLIFEQLRILKNRNRQLNSQDETAANLNGDVSAQLIANMDMMCRLISVQEALIAGDLEILDEDGDETVIQPDLLNPAECDSEF